MLAYQYTTTRLIFLLILIISGPISSAQAQTSPQDRLTLLTLRSTLSLRSKDWPIKTDPCSTWRGIQCSQTTPHQNITSINISYFRRTRVGNLNPNRFSIRPLFNLTSLTTFNASHFPLPGPIPPWLFSRVRVLDLTSCSINGTLPDSTSNSSYNVNELHLSNNRISGGLPFSLLVGLDVLDVSNNNLTGFVTNELWSLLFSFRLLDLSGNSFTGVLSTNNNDTTTTTLSNNGVFNVSGNLFYGEVTSLVVIRRFAVIDLSRNYFEGVVPSSYVNVNSSSLLLVSGNCFRNVSDQRSLRECGSFYSDRGLVFDNFGQIETQTRFNRHHRRRRLVIVLVSVFGLVMLGVIVFVLFMICKRMRRGKNEERGLSRVGSVVRAGGAGNPPPAGVVSLNFSNLGDKFSHQQILQATDELNGANLIKNGHSGDIFHGILEGGIPVIIKKVSVRKTESYMLELDLFSKVSHTRLVPLLGHCLEDENEKFLVYKRMPNGDLTSSLFKKTVSDDSLKSLDWITRLKIAIGAAEGLAYLHHECSPPLVHRDIQASSILLDDKFEVRLGSLTEVCAQEGDGHQKRITRLLRLPQTADQGTSGMPNATCAYDVYCFGKVLLELVTGKLGISSPTNPAAKESLESVLPYISIYDKELVTNIVDPTLIIDEDLLEEVWSMSIVARSCLNPKPNRRPMMRYILKALENPLKVVREEHTSSARLRTNSSRGSWNNALFGSWRSSSDVAAAPYQKVEVKNSPKNAGHSGSLASEGYNGHSSSTRRHSKENFPEPLEEHDFERANEEYK